MAEQGVNKVILIGRLGADPEVRYMASGDPVANIRLATSISWQDKASGERKERTEWHGIVFFKGLAGIAGEYLKKGSKIYVEGALRTRKWQGQDGLDKYTTEIVASEMNMLDGKQNNQDVAKNGTSVQPDSTVPPTPSVVSNGPDDFDDDIPF